MWCVMWGAWLRVHIDTDTTEPKIVGNLRFLVLWLLDFLEEGGRLVKRLSWN